MLYLTGDHHFAHSNIITYAKRNFKSVDHMNMELLKRWNEVVGPRDTVIHLGDFCFERGEQDHRYWRDQLNGDIVFLQGNHDSHKNAPFQSLVFKHSGIDWWCSHYPERRYRHNLSAHVHDRWRIKKTGMDVIVNCGVDFWGGYPITVQQILDAIKDAPYGESI